MEREESKHRPEHASRWGITWRLSGAGLALLASVACASSPSTSLTAPSPSSLTLTSEALSAMESGIQDEYRAESIYEGVILDFGPILPFTAIIRAEVRHSSSSGQLFSNRGLTIPVSEASASTVPRFSTVREACAAAVVAERENIALYDQLLNRVLPSDVRQVFSNNRRASLDNHLPAFLACS